MGKAESSPHRSLKHSVTLIALLLLVKRLVNFKVFREKLVSVLNSLFFKLFSDFKPLFLLCFYKLRHHPTVFLCIIYFLN